jgi:hypothetical protein
MKKGRDRINDLTIARAKVAILALGHVKRQPRIRGNGSQSELDILFVGLPDM